MRANARRRFLAEKTVHCPGRMGIAFIARAEKPALIPVIIVLDA
jgi:hypothetical protein